MPERLYPLLLVVPGVVALLVARYAWLRRQMPAAGALAAVMSSVAVWSLASAGELASGSLASAYGWVHVEYVGVAALPVTWFMFALFYSGHGDWLTRRRLVLLSVPPALVLLAQWTDPWHHLFYRGISLAPVTYVSSLVPQPGPAYWLHAGYSYLLILIGLVCIIRTTLRAGPRHRDQGVLVILAVLAPWITNACYLAGIGPIPGVDLTPFAFTLTGLALTWALFRLRLLELAPVARDAVFEAISDGVVVVDEHERVLDLNRAAAGLLGCSASEAFGMAVADLVPWWPQVRGYCDDNGGHRLRQRLGEGTDERILECRLFLLQRHHGRPPSRLLFLSDVTEQQRAHEALRAVEVSYHELFNAVGEAIYIQDREGRFLDINYGAELMYGYPREFFLGKTPEVLSAPGRNDLEAIREKVERAFAGEPQQFEFWGRRANGQEFPKDVRLYKGTYLGQDVVIALAVDVTARKQVENAQRLAGVGQLAAGVAHEFNNLLAAILLQAEMADPDDPHQARDLKELVIRAARRGGATCADLMAFARPAEPRREPVALRDIIARALAVAHRQLENAQVEVVQDNRMPGARVHADARQLEQVLFNLIINAVDAMNTTLVPLGRRRLVVGVSRTDPGTDLTLSVTDTGTGIAAEHIARVFEPFFTTKTADMDSDLRGTGLGLSVSHGIVAAHGGRMEVRSEPPRGTTFIVHLPLLDEAADDASAAETAPAPQLPTMRPSRILLAEDEADVRRAVVEALTQLGHQVTAAATTEEAVAALRRRPFDAVVTDLMMPGAGGSAIVTWARAQTPPPPTLVITGKLEPQLREEMLAIGATAVLQKPFSLTKLLEILAEMLPPEG